MNGEKGKRKITILVVAIALVLTVSIVVSFLLSVNPNDQSGIQLPAASEQATVQTETEIIPTEEQFLEITGDNLKSVIETLNRADSYYRKLQIETIWSLGTGTQTVEVWCSGNKMKVVITNLDSGRVKHLLTDGDRVFIWYEGQDGLYEGKLNDTFTLDDLQMIPTYESIIDLPKEKISRSEYVALEDGKNCIFVEFQTELKDYVERYWISVDTGLLVQVSTLQNGEHTYRMYEVEMEQIPSTDDAFKYRFILPDGTELD